MPELMTKAFVFSSSLIKQSRKGLTFLGSQGMRVSSIFFSGSCPLKAYGTSRSRTTSVVIINLATESVRNEFEEATKYKINMSLQVTCKSPGVFPVHSMYSPWNSTRLPTPQQDETQKWRHASSRLDPVLFAMFEIKVE